MKVIYVDDEKILLQNFRMTAGELARVDTLDTFNSGDTAIEWAKSNPVDVAFLDIEMPVMNGIEVAKRLKGIDENIRIIFVTAYEQYALQAFGVDAIGYLLKPYSREDIEKELDKAYYIKQRPKKNVQIQTMPDLIITVDGTPLRLGHTKQEELLALLIDRGETGITKVDAISALWSGYSSDNIYWTTMSRLKSILDEAGISDILVTKGQTKCIDTDKVECDLYRMIDGDSSVIEGYNGKYLQRFAWAEETRAQLDEIKDKYKNN